MNGTIVFAVLCATFFIGFIIHTFWGAMFAFSPFSALRRFARRRDRSHELALIIAGNPRVTAEELADIAKDSNQYLRSLAAHHPVTSPETLRSLATDESRIVRKALTENPNTPEDVSALLALEMMVDPKS